MDRQGPRFRGGPEGQHGDGTNRLSDTEDSVVTRKKSLRGRRQEEDDQEDGDSGGYLEPHPAYDDNDDDDNGRMNPGRRSTRDSPQDRQSAGSHGMDDMSLPPSGPGRGRGNGPPEMDSYGDSRELDSPGGRGGGKSVSLMERFYIRYDIPTLREFRAESAERLRMLNRNGAGKDYHGYNFDIFCRIRCIKDIMGLDEEIADLEGRQSESSKMPREMGPPTHMMDPNPRQSRAGGRESFEARGELLDDTLDTPEMRELTQQRDSLKKILIEYYDSGDLEGDRLETARTLDKDLDFTNQAIARLELERQRDTLKKKMLAIYDSGGLKGDRLEVARVLDKELDDTTQAIARLELEQHQGGKTRHGTRAGRPFRHHVHERFDDEGSDFDQVDMLLAELAKPSQRRNLHGGYPRGM